LGSNPDKTTDRTGGAADLVSTNGEAFVSVDVETAGPIPGEYSLLSIGACHVYEPAKTFSCELKPLNRNADSKALKVAGLSLVTLEKRGLTPEQAMQRLDAWLIESTGLDCKPVFVGMNAPFDWSFVNYYFHRFLGRNPFGFAALDIKAYYMGAMGCSWAETRSSLMAEMLKPERSSDHRALADAQYQAELFRLLREQDKHAITDGASAVSGTRNHRP
jgi:DNA polymerase III epsilon subunit-like protein